MCVCVYNNRTQYKYNFSQKVSEGKNAHIYKRRRLFVSSSTKQVNMIETRSYNNCFSSTIARVNRFRNLILCAALRISGKLHCIKARTIITLPTVYIAIARARIFSVCVCRLPDNVNFALLYPLQLRHTRCCGVNRGCTWHTLSVQED